MARVPPMTSLVFCPLSSFSASGPLLPEDFSESSSVTRALEHTSQPAEHGGVQGVPAVKLVLGLRCPQTLS